MMEGGWAYRCHLDVDRVRDSLARACVPEKEKLLPDLLQELVFKFLCRGALTGYRNWIWSFKRWWMNQGWLLPQQERWENLGWLSPQQQSLRKSWITSTEPLSGKSVWGRFNWTREGLWLDKRQKILGSINWTGLGLECIQLDKRQGDLWSRSDWTRQGIWSLQLSLQKKNL